MIGEALKALRHRLGHAKNGLGSHRAHPVPMEPYLTALPSLESSSGYPTEREGRHPRRTVPKPKVDARSSRLAATARRARR